MESDRKLLELAAKAAGFGDPKKCRNCWVESEYPPKSGKRGALWNYVGHMDSAELWNPLTDDGDALRLAVKMGMDLGIYLNQVGRTYANTRHLLGYGTDGEASWQNHAYFKENHATDPYAATRRAIVRAAAEIGKTLG